MGAIRSDEMGGIRVNRLEHIAKLLATSDDKTDGEVLDSVWHFLVDICDINPEQFRDIEEGK